MTQSTHLVGGKDGRSLAISGGNIVATPAEGQTIDCAGAELIAGRVNAHTHIYSGLAPLGMPAPEPTPENFVQILERVWWRLDRALTEASLRASARLYAAEALLAGTTTLIDHHESPNFIEGSLDVLADVCTDLGIRGLFCFGATERNGGIDEANKGLAECARFLKDNQRPLACGAIALHASFTVSDETVSRAAELCRELNTIMHVHLAEDAADVEDAKNRGHDGPFERLLALGALPPGSILAHGVFLSAEQVRKAEQEGLWLVHNPRSNEGNAVGYSANLAHSKRVALGTDGYPAVMPDELAALMRLAEQHGDSVEDATARPERGRQLVEERFNIRLGLDEGCSADVVVLDPNDERRARHVFVNGEQVVADGALVRGDLEQIRQEAQAAAAELWQRMRAL